jgi:hypothetical protein
MEVAADCDQLLPYLVDAARHVGEQAVRSGHPTILPSRGNSAWQREDFSYLK